MIQASVSRPGPAYLIDQDLMTDTIEAGQIVVEGEGGIQSWIEARKSNAFLESIAAARNVDKAESGGEKNHDTDLVSSLSQQQAAFP